MYRRAEEKLKAVDIERRDREYRLKQTELFMVTLKKLPEGENIESTELFMALVDMVIVGGRADICFEGWDDTRGTVLDGIIQNSCRRS